MLRPVVAATVILVAAACAPTAGPNDDGGAGANDGGERGAQAPRDGGPGGCDLYGVDEVVDRLKAQRDGFCDACYDHCGSVFQCAATHRRCDAGTCVAHSDRPDLVRPSSSAGCLGFNPAPGTPRDDDGDRAADAGG